MCKARKLPCGGTQANVVSRLLTAVDVVQKTAGDHSRARVPSVSSEGIWWRQSSRISLCLSSGRCRGSMRVSAQRDERVGFHRQQQAASVDFSRLPMNEASSSRDAVLCTCYPRMAGDPQTESEPCLQSTKYIYIIYFLSWLRVDSGQWWRCRTCVRQARAR